MRNFLIALTLCAAIPATVDANNGSNGGGSKPTATIKVRNNARGQTLVVIVDRPSSVSLSSSRAQFEAAGGKVLAWKEFGTFKVRAGAHTVEAAFLNPDFLPGSDAEVSTLNLGKHDTRSLFYNGNPSNIFLE